MNFPQTYVVLKKQIFHSRDFSIVPIRYEDRYDIMKWRNEQIYHLRQSEPLTVEQQDHYFNNVVKNLFFSKSPNQILFSFLKKDVCIGYGGIVHINWIDMHGELSFIMNTSLEKYDFHLNWSVYLSLIQEVAFRFLNLHKVFVYAYDLRPQLYEVLDANKFYFEARLKEHCFYDNRFLDVVIYSKIDSKK